MAKIFVSHAVADKELVDVFVDFLQTACGVKVDDIFCSSLEGMTIPEGKPFVEFIESRMNDAEIVIMILTPAFYESVFCLCELGATWILKHNNFPLLVPPLEFSDLKAVLSPRHGAKINEPSDLANLFDRLKSLGVANVATARFDLKRDAFLAKLKTLKIQGRTNIPAKDYEDLKKKYDDSVKEMISYEEAIAKLKTQFDELATKKDADDVNAVLLAGSTEPENFARLAKDVRAVMRKLPSTAVEAMFSKERREKYVLPDYYGNESSHQDAKKAAEKQIIELDGMTATLIDSHPLVREANKAVRELGQFMDNVTEPFSVTYEEENGHQLSLDNRDFWETNLGL